MLRVTGRVTRLDQKSGTKVNAATGEARDWRMNVIKVLVADQAVVEVTAFSDHTMPLPSVGDEVDYAVECSVNGRYLAINLDKPWSELFPPAESSKRVTAVA